ncbi:hypothetical protein CWI39_0338p0010 [Hamiltosporidium magnivora]|uniref:Uncharacterized protein n=1 Tax=Hamiltosporidium magnivora TaxID=148818 RepID=A0A4Q9LGR4_9MICR|nr:hypothetical protein CWI39_0338p0010 [Hamiltosporidium magnivora]
MDSQKEKRLSQTSHDHSTKIIKRISNMSETTNENMNENCTCKIESFSYKIQEAENIFQPKKSSTCAKNYFKENIHIQMVFRMKLAQTNPNIFLKAQNVAHEAHKPITMYDFSIIYLNFLMAINIGPERNSIIIFDLNVFSAVFDTNYSDNLIDKFIKKLIDDPILYNKEERNIFIIILLIVLIYTIRNNFEKYTVLLKRKIYDNSHLYEFVRCNFYYFYTKDITIDKLLLRCDPLLDLRQESIFLNFFYKKYFLKDKIDENLLLLFQKRILTKLKKIDGNHVFTFLKNIFLYETVIYDISTKENVLKVIVSFYSTVLNLKIKETVVQSSFNILEIVFTIFSVEDTCFQTISNGIINFPLTNKTTLKYTYLWKIRMSLDFDDLKCLIQEYKDNFIYLMLYFDEIFGIFSIIDLVDICLENICKCIEYIVYTFEDIKIEFNLKYITEYIKYLTILFVKINKKMEAMKITDYQILKNLNFNTWNKISKIILISHKFIYKQIEVESKKKKTINRKSNVFDKYLLSLVKAIRDSESKIMIFTQENNIEENIIRVKYQSLIVNEIPETEF